MTVINNSRGKARARKASESAQLFGALARAQSSGLDALQSIALLPLTESEQRSLQKALARGQSLSDSLLRFGTVTPTESRLIRAGELSGKTELIAQTLEQHYLQRERFAAQLSKHLRYPLILIFLMIVLSIFNGLIQQAANAGAVLLQGGFLITALWCLWRRLRYRAHYGRIALANGWWLRLADWRSRNHYLGRKVDCDFLRLWACLTGAGMDYQSALSNLASLLPRDWRRRCLDAAAQVRAGGGLINALRDAGLVQARVNLQLLRTADHVGKLQPELQRLLKELDEALSLQQDAMLDWAGKILYFLALCLAAYAYF